MRQPRAVKEPRRVQGQSIMGLVLDRIGKLIALHLQKRSPGL